MVVTLTNADTVRSFVEAIHDGAASACAGLDRPGLLQIEKSLDRNSNAGLAARVVGLIGCVT
jgi:hypothetical protein